MDNLISIDRLKQVLSYNPYTGVWTWLARLSMRVRVGSIAGTNNGHGYQIRVDGKFYKSHRLAWFYMTGEWPIYEIDHKDTDPWNNKWGNLREATRSQNECNTRMHVDNLHKLKGVSKNKEYSRYKSRIRVNGKNFHLGYFDSPEDAYKAYCEAAIKYHGEFARIK